MVLHADLSQESVQSIEKMSKKLKKVLQIVPKLYVWESVLKVEKFWCVAQGQLFTKRAL